ncbi:HlyD family type I secretion periplasmic adaptor subunit [Erythrobacter sp.]|uniref:HlyD family type I secretion periplasmic adaptor subunit n=1 Tax=Erythrobacter sp. TaxID=1042 RepID=UPI003C73CB03
MSALADRLPTLSRHWNALRESWRDQNAADKAFKPRDEHEFLPAALEIMEKPASPGLRWLMLLTCTLFVLALIWAIVGKVDVVAVASGKTVPAGNVKVIQPMEIGSVRAIHVTNGQFVEKGELLIGLDSTLAVADEALSQQQLLSARIARARNDALLAHLEGRPAVFRAPQSTSSSTAQTEQAFIDSATAQYDAQRASLLQQRYESEAELQAANAEIAKLEEALPYLDRQLDARAELAEKGFYSKLQLLEYEQLRAEHVRNIEIQQANRARAQASVGRLDADLANLRAEFGRSAIGELVAADEQAVMADEELRKSAKRRQFQELRAPVDGVVQQLAVTTVGGVVQPAQALMVIVPCSETGLGSASCEGGIAVEAFVQNKDIGFIEKGQEVAVKLETFNFTDYGTITGVVETISRDSIGSGDGSGARDVGAQDAGAAPLRPVFAAKIRLKCEEQDAQRTALCESVSPGMSVQAEIKTGQRRIIQYLLSPVRRSIGEAGRER